MVADRPRLLRIFFYALLPVFLFLLIELLLRAVHFGYPASFFRTAAGSEGKVVCDNPLFFYRFFPPRLSRSTGRFVFQQPKPKDLRRIFVFGSSAAMGDPDCSYSFSRMLEKMLSAAHPDQRFQVINTAATAINSHVVLPIMRQCGRMEPDLYIVLMGNNEVIGPYGPAAVLTSWQRRYGMLRLNVELRGTKWGQLAESIRRRLYRSSEEMEEWGGLELFLRQRIRYDDPALSTVYHFFDRNLNALCRTAAKHNTPLVLCTVPTNMVDWPPFFSQLSTLQADIRAQWQMNFQQGVHAEKAGAPEEAVRFFRRAAAADSAHAELIYRLARCEAALGGTNAARDRFIRARDLDALRFRADSRINELIRRHASAAGVSLMDLDSLFLDKCCEPTDAELFVDHVHFTPQGNYLIAHSLLPMVERILSLTNAQAPTFEKVMHDLAYTGWDALRVQEEIRQRLERPPFTEQCDHDLRVAKLDARLHMMQPLKSPDAVLTAQKWYKAATAKYPNDWILDENYGKFLLTAMHNAAAADSCFETVLLRLPNDALALTNLGAAKSRLQNWDEAEACFARALREMPHLTRAAVNLAQVLVEQEKLVEAEKVLRDHPLPNFEAADLHNSLGVRFARIGDDQAVAHFDKAVQLNPNLGQAHFNLGLAMKERGDLEASLYYLSRAGQLLPDNYEVHLELAAALRAVDRFEEAIAHYQAALILRPQSIDVHNDLGVLYAQIGLLTDAEARFDAALSLDLNNLSALSNLAMVHSLSGRSDKAVSYLKRICRLSNRPEFPYRIGLEFLKMNRPDSARFYLTRAFDLKPDFMPAVEKLDSLNRSTNAPIMRPEE